MLNIINHCSDDPASNLAMEEYFLIRKHLDQDLFFVWQNRPTVVVGRHQDTWREIDSQYLAERSVGVVRRLSGGGAVYHDKGNINFTYIKRNCSRRQSSFEQFARPIIRSLAGFGVKAEFGGRNDVLINGNKISGNAQYFWRESLLHHGTLLFNTDLAEMGSCLRPCPLKLGSHGVRSVPARVANVKPLLDPSVSLEDVKTALISAVFEERNAPYREYGLSGSDLREIEAIANSRYRRQQWNYGRNPSYQIRRQKRFAGGTISVYLSVEQGIIVACGIYGDYFADEPLDGIAAALVGKTYEKRQLFEIIEALSVEERLPNITTEEFLSCILDSEENREA